MAEKKLTPWQVLRYKFPENEYVLIEEVSNDSGFGRSRSLDYMLINLWPSRGLSITGIEQKTWRNDWLKELKNPAKQESHFKHCDYFYLLTTTEGVAKLEEIPLNWGWYHINEKGILKKMKEAPELKAEPIHRGLLCAMLRRAASKQGYVRVDELETKINEAAERKKDQQRTENKRELEEYGKLKERIKAFEEASGVEISSSWTWAGDVKKYAHALKWLKNHGIDYFERSLVGLQETAKKIYEQISKTLSTEITQPVKQEEDES